MRTEATRIAEAGLIVTYCRDENDPVMRCTNEIWRFDDEGAVAAETEAGANLIRIRIGRNRPLRWEVLRVLAEDGRLRGSALRRLIARMDRDVPGAATDIDRRRAAESLRRFSAWDPPGLIGGEIEPVQEPAPEPAAAQND